MRHIIMMGDSIMQHNDFRTYPQTGWGQVLSLFTKKDVEILNFAKNGRSTKSFIDEKRLEAAKTCMTKGDLVIISFGHNDEKIQDETRYTKAFGDFKNNLKAMIKIAKRRECYVILASPVARRKFINGHIVDTHKEYPIAMKEVADEEAISFVDLNILSMEALTAIGENESKKYFMNFDIGLYRNYMEGKEDDSHLRYDGAVLIATLFYDCVKYLKNIQDFFIDMENEDELIVSRGLI